MLLQTNGPCYLIYIPDVLLNCTDHIYTILVQARLHTFRGGSEIPWGKDSITDLQNRLRCMKGA